MSLSESAVFEKLKVKYPAPEFVLLPQVRNATGFTRTVRTADALMISTYPSRGIHLYGFEIKSSRSDWLNELKQPDKAEEIGRFCHFWFVVTGEKGIVKPDELPANWGLIEPHGDGLRVKAVATLRQPESLSLPFLAGILRKAADVVTDEAIISGRIDKAIKAALDEREKYAKNSNNYYKSEYEKLVRKVRDFEAKAGVNLEYMYNIDDVAAALKCLIHSHPETLINRLCNIQNHAEQVANQAANGIAALSELSKNSGCVNELCSPRPQQINPPPITES